MLTEIGIGETCTAVITSHLETGENFDGAITIGHYDSPDEIWIQARGVTVSINVTDVDALCKQLKRAKALALEFKEQSQ